MKKGIYKITNIISNKCYIGSSQNIESRFRRHKKDLKNGEHHSRYLQRAWNKYGEKNFLFEIIEEVTDKSQLIEREQHYTDKIKPDYSIRKICSSNIGIKHSKETRKKWSEARMGKEPWNKGTPCREETKERISKANLGKKPWNKGIPCSEKVKKAISKANKGNKYALGHVVSIDSRKKMSNKRKDRKLSLKQIDEIKNLHAHLSIRKLAKMFKVSYLTIWRAINDKLYLYVSEEGGK
jgi:group I intron endonuclease